MKSACYSPSDDMLSAWRPIPIAVMIPLEKVGSGWRGSQSPPLHVPKICRPGC